MNERDPWLERADRMIAATERRLQRDPRYIHLKAMADLEEQMTPTVWIFRNRLRLLLEVETPL